MAETYGMSEAEMLQHPTVYRSDLFDGQVVLISGAGSGLGKATAILFARLGATVVTCGRDQDKLDAVAKVFGDAGLSLDTHNVTMYGLSLNAEAVRLYRA